MEPSFWKVQIRVGKNGTKQVTTSILAADGIQFRETETLTGPEAITDVVANHLASADKNFQARLAIRSGQVSKTD